MTPRADDRNRSHHRPSPVRSRQAPRRRASTAGRVAAILAATSFAVVLGDVASAADAVAGAPADPAAAGYEMSGGRAASGAGLLASLVGIALGVLELVRLRQPSRRSAGRPARAAVLAGVVAVVLGAATMLGADGGVGSGEGVGGAVLAVVLGVVSALLGAASLVRGRRRAAAPSS
ncbi:DUF6223 family protein [Nocardioides sp. TF02-7]|uniref:DUF6223 family protein n=1 Tax=Nocardioides sp. TF02-7 TaxID=2917724 RepID=UPI001F063C4B|nr:DUF6223 family protein [Nocardioides sp. TF02-7]UMG91860.1 DUF6223 family protein [Nocardioides sp. TF02-7]